MDKTR